MKQDSVRIIEALGGAENIEDVDACITRLRVSVKDVEKVNKATLKDIGAVDVLDVKGGIQATDKNGSDTTTQNGPQGGTANQ